MKVLLIHPSLENTSWYSGCEGPKVASLTLPTVAALTPKDIEVSIIDERVDEIDYENAPDLVGITFMSRLALRAYHIAGEFRKRGTTVVVGGIHPTAMPDEALKHADAIVLGEAEGVWPQLLEDFKKNHLEKFYKSKEPPSLRGLPFARRDLLTSKKYLTKNVIQATRGCPYRCNFCLTSKFFRNSFRMRPVNEVINEVKTLSGKDLLFLDDNIVGKRDYAFQLFSSLAHEKKWWFSQSDISIAKDTKLLRAAAKSGCKVLLIGFETLVRKNLSSINKRWSPISEYKQAIKKIHDHGIGIIASFIVGLEWDDPKIFERILEFLIENKVEFMQCNPIAYFPGTNLMESSQATNSLQNDCWWLNKFDNHFKVHHNPKSISVEDLENGCVWLYKKFYSYESIMKRLMHTPLPMLSYSVLVNLGFRKIYKSISLKGYNPAEQNRIRKDEIRFVNTSQSEKEEVIDANMKSS